MGRFGLGFGLRMAPAIVRAAPAITPISILGSKLVDWFDSNDASTLWGDPDKTVPADGDHPIAIWQNKAPAGIDLANDTGDSDTYPFYAFDAVSGVTFFNPNSTFLQYLASQVQPVEILMLLRSYVDSPDNSSFTDGGSAVNSMRLYQVSTGQFNVKCPGDVLVTLTPEFSRPVFLRSLFNGASSETEYDDQGPQAGSPGTSAPNGLTMGKNGDDSAAGYSHCTMFEFIRTNAAMTSGERTALYDFMAAKWTALGVIS